MAIKGKKKSQKKGGPPRRRPPGAPRQIVTPKKATPWYKTQTTRVLALLGLLVIASVIIVIVQNARDDAAALEDRQDKIDNYTDDVRALVQKVRPQVSAMATVPPSDIPDDKAADLEKDSKKWANALAKTQAQVGTLPQVSDLEPVTPLYAQAIQLYATTARSYGLGLSLSGDEQTQALATAAEIKAQAGALWTQATAQLDQVRAEEEMEPSGLTPPDPAAAGAQQPPIPGGGAVPPGGVPPGGIPPGQVPPGLQPGAPPGGGGGGGGGD
jgi:hypothetical protein